MALLSKGLKTRQIKAKDLQDGMTVIYNDRCHLEIRYVLRQTDMVSVLGTWHDLHVDEDDFRDYQNNILLTILDRTP